MSNQNARSLERTPSSPLGDNYLEVTTTENVVSVHFKFAPYALKYGTWNAKRETVENLAIKS
jgi:hypothetical protein